MKFKQIKSGIILLTTACLMPLFYAFFYTIGPEFIRHSDGYCLRLSCCLFGSAFAFTGVLLLWSELAKELKDKDNQESLN